jgi:7,8-dihydropterin-6-yl-methyl-4-(beta-D-ribofuranosyl)aminobenzene 5'-phosphate synthase
MCAGLRPLNSRIGRRFLKPICQLFIGVLALTLAQSSTGNVVSESTNPTTPRLTVVFNNVAYKPGLATGWGFACIVQGYAKTILFDTGASGEVLLANLKSLGFSPSDVDVVVLSHAHGDHTGGLQRFLERRHDVTVYFPESFPATYKTTITGYGAKVVTTNKPQSLFDGVHTTGELGRAIKEQALILDTPRGLVLITGCAHPHIDKIAAVAKDYLHKDIYLLMGGFHLLDRSETDIKNIIKALKSLGVQKVAPSHCTGETAMALFRDAWQDNYIEGGLGAVIEIH